MNDYQKGYIESLDDCKNIMLSIIENNVFTKEEIYRRFNELMCDKLNRWINEK